MPSGTPSDLRVMGEYLLIAKNPAFQAEVSMPLGKRRLLKNCKKRVIIFSKVRVKEVL